MAEPTKKAPEIRELQSKLTGDDPEAAIRADRCIKPPVGCGGPAVEFADDLSRQEFRISGLCQKCQDSVFGAEEWIDPVNP